MEQLWGYDIIRFIEYIYIYNLLETCFFFSKVNIIELFLEIFFYILFFRFGGYRTGKMMYR